MADIEATIKNNGMVFSAELYASPTKIGNAIFIAGRAKAVHSNSTFEYIVDAVE